MNLRNFLALCGLFLFFSYEPANSTPTSIETNDDRCCGYSGSEQDICGSYCYKSIKPSLAYLIELKEQMKATAQANIDKDNRLLELTKRLLEMNEWKDQVKDINNKIEYLTKTNDRLRASIEEQNQSAKIEKFITKTINNQKAEIEDLKLKVAIGEKNSILIKKIENISKASCIGLPSGIHFISISGLDPFPALCNGDIAGGGWMLIYRRFDGGRDNFGRYWTDFRNGFGSLDKEFFIGLETLHQLTNSGTYELYIQVKYFKKNIQFATYDNFNIGDEDTKYKLESLGKFNGTAFNRLQFFLNQKFTTVDQDNDNHSTENCATHFGNGWWYDECTPATFGVRYYEIDETTKMPKELPLMLFQMLIRPISKVQHE